VSIRSHQAARRQGCLPRWSLSTAITKRATAHPYPWKDSSRPSRIGSRPVADAPTRCDLSRSPASQCSTYEGVHIRRINHDASFDDAKKGNEYCAHTYHPRSKQGREQQCALHRTFHDGRMKMFEFKTVEDLKRYLADATRRGITGFPERRNSSRDVLTLLPHPTRPRLVIHTMQPWH